MLYFLIVSLKYPYFHITGENIYDDGGNILDKITKQDLLSYVSNSSDTISKIRRMNKQSVTFVTPWNNDGYYLTEVFGEKFTFIVPTWFFIEIKENILSFGGLDSVNETWINIMRENHGHITICPRLLISLPEDVLIKRMKEVKNLIKTNIIPIYSKYDFDDIFLEVLPLVTDTSKHSYLLELIDFIKTIRGRRKLHVSSYFPTYMYQYLFPKSKYIPSIFKSLKYIFMAAYDIPSGTSIYPEDVVVNTTLIARYFNSNNKLIVGLPFFGYDFHSNHKDPFFGDKFIEILSREESLFYFDEKDNEHILIYKENGEVHSVHYPVPVDLRKRINAVIKENIAGFGFWEISQSTPCLLDIL